MIQIFIVVLATLLSSQAMGTSNIGATLLGAAGSILIHESGHAVTSHFLGGEVLAFRPYPHKAKYLTENGTVEERWYAGLIMSQPIVGENADRKNAWVAAMGSGANLLSVFLLAPLLPEVKSEFSRSSLDSMLYFSALDIAAYTSVDMITGEKTNDWNRVADLTGVSIYWYWVGGIAASFLANEYRAHWHNRALPAGQKDSRFSVGFSHSYE